MTQLTLFDQQSISDHSQTFVISRPSGTSEDTKVLLAIYGTDFSGCTFSLQFEDPNGAYHDANETSLESTKSGLYELNYHPDIKLRLNLDVSGGGTPNVSAFVLGAKAAT